MYIIKYNCTDAMCLKNNCIFTEHLSYSDDKVLKVYSNNYCRDSCIALNTINSLYMMQSVQNGMLHSIPVRPDLWLFVIHGHPETNHIWITRAVIIYFHLLKRLR